MGIGLAAMILLAAGVLYSQYGGQHSLEWLAEHEQQLRDSFAARPLATALILFFLYAAVTGSSIPWATFLSLLVANLLGFWKALLIVSFASTLGATLAMLASRYFFREAVQRRLAGRYGHLLEHLETEGPYYLVAMRLTPYIPYFAINLLMGLTRMRVRTFWWVSQLGMLPITCVYLWTGSQLPGFAELAEHGVGRLFSPSLLVALCMLAVVPIALRQLVRKKFQINETGDEEITHPQP